MRRLLKTALMGALAGVLLASCAPAAPKQEAAAPAGPAETKPAALTPSKSGYADVNGIKLYHEIYGQGDPLVVVPGGFMTIPEMMPLIEPLAKTRQVIAVEIQGHGRSADTDRPFELETLGDDIAVLLDQLNIAQADIVGYSLGADVGLRTAFQHPDKVRRLVVISTAYKTDGWYPEVQVGMSQVGASMTESMLQTPTGKFSQQWPEPQRFPQFLDKMGKKMGERYDWTAEVKKLPMPVMLVFADNDSISQEHVSDFFALLGGGVKEPGWQNTQLSKARLAVISGYSHYNFMTSTEIAPVIAKYLADPLTNPPAGAAPASQAAPDLSKS
jgi:pimeloyl-ACP methyl ester carboxylesterase